MVLVSVDDVDLLLFPKRIFLSLLFLCFFCSDHLDVTPVMPLSSSKGNPFTGGIKYTVGVVAINVNRKKFVQNLSSGFYCIVGVF